MVSKKEILILGVIAIGGIGLASMLAGKDVGGGKEKSLYYQRYGTIGGGEGGVSPITYVLGGGDGFTGFPEPTGDFDIKGFLQPTQPIPTTVSSTGKKAPSISHPGGTAYATKKGKIMYQPKGTDVSISYSQARYMESKGATSAHIKKTAISHAKTQKTIASRKASGYYTSLGGVD